jgi:hypothetical protein
MGGKTHPPCGHSRAKILLPVPALTHCCTAGLDPTKQVPLLSTCARVRAVLLCWAVPRLPVLLEATAAVLRPIQAPAAQPVALRRQSRCPGNAARGEAAPAKTLFLWALVSSDQDDPDSLARVADSCLLPPSCHCARCVSRLRVTGAGSSAADQHRQCLGVWDAASKATAPDTSSPPLGGVAGRSMVVDEAPRTWSD